jgi:hypothetical protein
VGPDHDARPGNRHPVARVARPPPSADAAPTTASPLTYVYDDAGRLEAVVDPTLPSGSLGIARYNYDDVGNLLSITRASHTAATIIDFSPKIGKAGDTATIYGAGFSSTPSQNVVRFTTTGGQSGSKGIQATVTSASATVLKVTVPAGGTGKLWVKNTATNSTSALSAQTYTFRASATPTITAIQNTSGAAITTASPGQAIWIVGTNFSTTPGGNVVTFNGVRAPVTASGSSATKLVVTVPPMATTGQVAVRTVHGKATAPGDLTLPTAAIPLTNIVSTTRTTIGAAALNVSIAAGKTALVVFRGTGGRAFTLTLSSALNHTSVYDPFGRKLRGGATTPWTLNAPIDGDYVVELENTGTSSVSRTVSIADAGVGTFGASARATSGVAASGPYLSDSDALAILEDAPRVPQVWRPDGERWTTGSDPSVFEEVRPLRAAQGVTAVAGQVLTLDGWPLAGVSVRVEGAAAATTTDPLGRFVLRAVDPGRAEIVVDGATANHGRARFATFVIGVDARRGVTTPMDGVVWMPRIDTATNTRIAFPTRREVILTNPSVPGLAVHIPAGARIRDLEGEPVRELSLTAVPLDRPPFPLPSLSDTPVYWTVQPGGATVWPEGAWVDYPAPTSRLPGGTTDFWYYEPDEGWETYGQGTISPDGSQVIPAPYVRLHEFTGAMIFGGKEPPGDANCDAAAGGSGGGASGPADPSAQGSCAGDPVDLGSGLFVHRYRDLYEPGPLPIDLTRIYRQNDVNPYYFGTGVTTRWEMGLQRSDGYCRVALIIPGERRVQFVSPNWPSNPTACSSSASATGANALVATTTGPFYGATLEYTNAPWYSQTSTYSYWRINRRDGTVMAFGNATGGLLDVVRDRFGNEIWLNRDPAATQGDRITSIVSYPSGRWINFTYVSANDDFVAAASDSAGRTVSYAYETVNAGSRFLQRLRFVTDAHQTTQSTPKKLEYRWNPTLTVNDNSTGLPSPGTQITEILDARGNRAVKNEFDAQGRVFRQTLANGGIFTYDYASADPACSGSVRVTDPNGNVSC